MKSHVMGNAMNIHHWDGSLISINFQKEHIPTATLIARK